MLVRKQYRGDGRRCESCRSFKSRAGRSRFGNVSVYVLRKRTGSYKKRDKRKRIDGRGRLLVFSENARADFQKDLRGGGDKSVYGGNREYPRTVFLDT